MSVEEAKKAAAGAAAVDSAADYSSDPFVEPHEEAEPEPDIHFEIMNYPADTTLKGYKEMWDNNQLQIPEFQRKYVWDQNQASRLIESFLLGLTVPGVFLYKERKKEKSGYLVIDGQQRIKTVAQFLSGAFESNGKSFKLKGVSAKWDGKSFNDLTESDRFKLETAIMRSTIIQQLEPDDNTSIYLIFERLNTGGVNLTPMEVRMCVSAGNFVKMLSRLNKNANWRRILGAEKKEHKRHKDKELILRTMALYDKGDAYFSTMKRFLNKYISDNNNLNDEKIKEKESLFLKAVEKACFLGDKPFHLKTRLNFSLTDSVICALMKSPFEDESKIKEAYQKLLADKEFIDLVVDKGDAFKTAVTKRLDIAERAFSGE